MTDDLWMSNPEGLPGNPPVPVTRLAFEGVWRYRGWQLVDAPAEESELAEQPITQQPTDTEPLAAASGETDNDDSDAGKAKSTGRTRKEVKP